MECANNDLGAEILEVLLPPMGLASYEAEFVSASSETFNDRGTTNVEVQTIKGSWAMRRTGCYSTPTSPSSGRVSLRPRRGPSD